MAIAELERRILEGGRVTAPEALELYLEAPTALLGRLADTIRARKHPERVVTYIIDRNVNYTNVCVARCNFCAFYREVGSAEGYVLGFEEIFRKIDETIALGGVQLLLQGGHNPDLPLAWYEDLFRAIKSRYPAFKLHALSPPEVIHLSRLSKLPVPQVIERLIDAGLDSIPGGGAEILVDRVRKLLNCYGKATADEWLDVMRHAHRAGLRTTATMMYGTVETVEERLEHLFRLRELQDETGGFTAFITWSYQPEHTELGGGEASGVEYLRTLAIARIVLDNFDNLQASWVTQGGKVGQLSLAYGANDMGSVMIEENVVRAAGASYCMDEIEIVRNIENAGFAAKRRNMHYEILGDPIFREREVPRMLELAVARADGDTSRAPEIDRYAARSASEKRRRQQGRSGHSIQATRTCRATAPATDHSDDPSASRGVGAAHRRSAHPRRLGGGPRRPGGRAGRRERPAARRPLPMFPTSRSCRRWSTPTCISSCRWMRGQVPPGDSMPAWASALIALRRSSATDAGAAIVRSDRRSTRRRHGAGRRHRQHHRHDRTAFAAARSPRWSSAS